MDLDSVYVNYERNYNSAKIRDSDEKICLQFNMKLAEPIGMN